MTPEVTELKPKADLYDAARALADRAIHLHYSPKTNTYEDYVSSESGDGGGQAVADEAYLLELACDACRSVGVRVTSLGRLRDVLKLAQPHLPTFTPYELD